MKTSDDEIIFSKAPEKEKPKRAPPGSKTIHFNAGTNEAPRSYCRHLRKNAQFFTKNWQKVTCHFCKTESTADFNRMRERAKNRKRHRKYIKSSAKRLNIFRNKGESFYNFEERVLEEVRKERAAIEKIEGEKYLQEISCLAFTTLPLEVEIFIFPLELEEANYSAMENCDTLTVDRKKYIELLKEMLEYIKVQLRVLEESD